MNAQFQGMFVISTTLLKTSMLNVALLMITVEYFWKEQIIRQQRYKKSPANLDRNKKKQEFVRHELSLRNQNALKCPLYR